MQEILVKILRENKTKYTAERPAIAAQYWKENISENIDNEKEHLVVLVLDSKLNVKAHILVSMGTINQTLVHAREVFRGAIAYAGSSIILMHNHPTNQVNPSSDDIISTRNIREAGELLGIPLVDHIIVASDNSSFTSLKELGIMQ